ncbi:MAG: inorganic phosphate transporter [Chloroflexi bacterium]|jgi:inorganic phosphate transporter, PiT family|nr:inorganic phosphate transporter [Chloroflexota bacterium]MBT7081721.1 inorganic phosphate transporter [Chloroflexota bacterium]MBT7289195.1 inorganic phosphate transporter [Chloroflexota bacterium]
MPDIALLVIIFVVAIAFGFSNGFNDAANAVAAAIGSRAIRPRYALVLAAVFDFAGCMAAAWLEPAVATTIGKGIISNTDLLTFEIVLAAVSAAVIWTLVATYKGLPISVSHSLVSGLVGAGLAALSPADIGWGKFGTTLASVVLAPLLGFIGAIVLMVVLLWAFHKLKPGFINNIIRKAQWATTAFFSFSHGLNDGQMPVALMVMGLTLYNGTDYWNKNPEVGAVVGIPPWIILIGATTIALGVIIGGYRVIKTVGFKVTSLQPIHGLSAQTAAAGVISLANARGIPVSTTHCGVATIIGVGATNRLSAVRWGVARRIVFAWISTFPICIGLGWVLGRLFTSWAS